jgi:hypothetical protein
MPFQNQWALVNFGNQDMAFLAPHFWSGKMCTLCELQLFNDHQALEREFYNLRPKCKKLPADASGHECYHCFSVGDIVDACPKCKGKPWSEEFLAARKEIEGEEKDPLPF